MKRKNARNQKRTKRITHETEKRFHNRQWQQLASLLQLTHLRDAMDAKKKIFFSTNQKKDLKNLDGDKVAAFLGQNRFCEVPLNLGFDMPQ
jgi:hypothetical protein